MRKRVFLSGILAMSLAVTSLSAGGVSANAEGGDVTASAGTAALLAEDEVQLEKSVGNPVTTAYTEDGKPVYGGDPAVLVDGDTIYLYTGHDEAVTEAYKITEWVCYSTKDLKDWKYEGVTMKADKGSIKWANTGQDAWAGQVAKYKDKYYFYYCTWDSTADGKQSIGVAVSDSPTGPFADIGEPLVRGTVTEPQSSNWNDIDPTVWIETDDAGVEHRYLAWGNGKYYVCELNEDMISVKDLNGDGKITCGTSSKSADIIDRTEGLSAFTEAPWLYRRQDENGKYYGRYYLFYAYGWREQMAYASTDSLLDGTWEFGKVLMPPAATSNTNHMAVFDFQGKTYFVYHNGSRPGGSGFRRSACITELKFDADGSIQAIPETAAGITGKVSAIYTNSGAKLSHATYTNSNSDSDYPYTKVKVGAGTGKEEGDSQWLIMAGKADASKASYVSIQSENKPGLYLTANSDKTVTLAQDADGAAATSKRQTFRTVKGLDNAAGVSFESVSEPGYYLTIQNQVLCLTKGTDKMGSTFYLNFDEKDTSLLSIGASIAKNKNQFYKGSKVNTKNVTVTALYANGTTKKITNFTSDAAKIDTSKTGSRNLTISYTEGGITKSTAVQVSIVARAAKVKNLKVSVKASKNTSKVKVRFKPVSGAKGYQLRYSIKKNKKLEYLDERAKSSFTYNDVDGLFKAGKTYYFYVRSYIKFNGDYKYSGYTSVKVKAK